MSQKIQRTALNDKFDLTLSGDELRKVLSLVRRDLSAIPCEREWCETSVWESRQRLLNGIEEKIVTSYNTSGSEELTDRQAYELYMR